MDETAARPSHWGRWGNEDERGAANFATPEALVAAAGLVKRGQVFSLSLPVQSTGVPVLPRRQAPLHLMSVDGGDYAAGLKRKSGFQSSDDYIALFTHGATHIDALAHVWYDDKLYNGFAGSTVRSTGATRCGIDKLVHLTGRGVLLDLCRHRGVDVLPGGDAIGPEELEACAATQGVALRQGDILLVKTGWLGTFDARNPDPFFAKEPGLSQAGAEWMGARGFAGIGMDNYGIEVVPTEDGSNAPVHRRLIRDFGIYMMEMLVLDELAAAEAWEFLFVVAPLRITGGVGSPINPLAIC